MAFLQPKVFLNVKSTHCLLSRIFSNPGLFPTKTSVSGSLFRSFAGWLFFGISRTIVCSYHWERFQGSLMKWLKLCLAREFLQGNLLVLRGELFLIFCLCKLMTKAMHRLIECRRGWDAQVVLDSDVLVGLTFWREQLSAELKFQTYMEETCFTFSGCLFRC